jgi:chromosomal replication initiation ATPase DnaA
MLNPSKDAIEIKIQTAIFDYFGYTFEEVFRAGKNIRGKYIRKREYSECRQLLCYFFMKMGKLSSMDVQRFMLIDHSTVLYSVKHVEDLLEGKNNHFATDFYNIRNLLRNVMNVFEYEDKIQNCEK